MLDLQKQLYRELGVTADVQRVVKLSHPDLITVTIDVESHHVNGTQLTSLRLGGRPLIKYQPGCLTVEGALMIATEALARAYARALDDGVFHYEQFKQAVREEVDLLTTPEEDE